MNFPVFSLNNREFGFRDGFAPDCLLQRRVRSELLPRTVIYAASGRAYRSAGAGIGAWNRCSFGALHLRERLTLRSL
jgi:hypothetical protein